MADDLVELQRDDYLYLAKLNYHIKRYSIAYENMKEVIEKNPKLNKEERLLLTSIVKQLYQIKNKHLEVIQSFLLIEKKDNLLIQIYLKDELELIKSEMIKLISEFIFLINSVLLSQNTHPEEQVFFIKIKADYLRYKIPLIEISDEKNDKNKTIQEAEKEYLNGIELSHSSLSPNNALRLSIELNYAVFIREILAKKEESIKYLKEEISNCRKETITEKDCEDVYNLINDNIILWNSCEKA